MDCNHHPRRDDGLDDLRCAWCGSPLERDAEGNWTATSDDDGQVVGT